MVANYLDSMGIDQALVSQPVFQRHGMLGSWVKDLEEIVDRQESPESTLMLGRAVVIEFSDLLAGREMLLEIAQMAGMGCEMPKIEDIRGWLSKEGELFPNREIACLIQQNGHIDDAYIVRLFQFFAGKYIFF